MGEVAIFTNARNLSSHQSLENLSENLILPINQTLFYGELDWHVFRVISLAQKRRPVKVENGDQPSIRIQSGQRFGQYKNYHFGDQSVGSKREGGKDIIVSFSCQLFTRLSKLT